MSFLSGLVRIIYEITSIFTKNQAELHYPKNLTLESGTPTAGITI